MTPEPFTNHPLRSGMWAGCARPMGMGEAAPSVGKWENPDTSAACTSSGAALNFNRKENSNDNRK